MEVFAFLYRHENQKHQRPSTMNEPDKQFRSLSEMEEAVLAEGQEWMRQRLQQNLQEQANQIGAPFPPGQSSAGSSAETKTHAAHTSRRGRR
jgi:hypothetical protein